MLRTGLKTPTDMVFQDGQDLFRAVVKQSSFNTDLIDVFVNLIRGINPMNRVGAGLSKVGIELYLDFAGEFRHNQTFSRGTRAEYAYFRGDQGSHRGDRGSNRANKGKTEY